MSTTFNLLSQAKDYIQQYKLETIENIEIDKIQLGFVGLEERIQKVRDKEFNSSIYNDESLLSAVELLNQQINFPMKFLSSIDQEGINKVRDCYDKVIKSYEAELAKVDAKSSKSSQNNSNNNNSARAVRTNNHPSSNMGFPNAGGSMVTGVVPNLSAPQMGATTQMGQALIQALLDKNDNGIDTILYDPQATGISAGELGVALAMSIKLFQDRYYKEILALPNAAHIPANGPGSIGEALVVVCGNQGPDELESLKQHPNFVNINANGTFGLGEALAAYLKAFLGERGGERGPDVPNAAYVKAIISHPNASQINHTQPLADLIGESLLYIAFQSEDHFRDEDEEIMNNLLHSSVAHLVSPNGQFGLGRVLVNGAYATTPEVVKAIIAHPNFSQINSNPIHVQNRPVGEIDRGLRQFGLQEALFMAVANGSPEMEDPTAGQLDIVQQLISTITTFSANGEFGLGRILVNAAESTTVDIVKVLLQLPSIKQISSNQITISKATPGEDVYSLDRFGFKEALFVSMRNENPLERILIAKELIDFTNHNQIILDANQAFGLAETLTEAASHEESLTMLILKSDSAKNIQANAPNSNTGGLDNALVNAAEKGFHEAVRAILKHPNAKQINSLKDSYDSALKASHRPIASTIVVFAKQNKIRYQ